MQASLLSASEELSSVSVFCGTTGTLQSLKKAVHPFGWAAFETVKKPADMKDDRVAGELEGARPASSWINRRPKGLDFSRLFG